jgi:hypothetical protein
MPGFWDDNERAQRVLREKGQIERVVNDWKALSRKRDDAQTLVELGEEGNDPSVADEVGKLVDELEGDLRALETRRMLAAPEDHMDAIVEINAGAGGTDAADWADMLVRMYVRWAERNGFTSEILDISYAEPAGIRSAVLAIRGPYSFGYLQSESGVHRLVRISPFDKDARRQTAFAAVAAYPEVDDSDRDRHQPGRHRDGDDAGLGRRGRSERQHHGLRGPPPPRPHRHGRRVPGRAEPAQEPRQGHEDAAGQAVPARAREAPRGPGRDRTPRRRRSTSAARSGPT